MEDIAAPLPKMKLNSRGQIIHSKNYDLEIDKEIYFLLIEILIDNKNKENNQIYFQLRNSTTFSIYHILYKYKTILKLFLLNDESYKDTSKIFNYFDKKKKKNKIQYEFKNEKSIIILKFNGVFEFKEINFDLKLKQVKVENNKLIEELKNRNNENKKQIKSLEERNKLLEEEIDKNQNIKGKIKKEDIIKAKKDTIKGEEGEEEEEEEGEEEEEEGEKEEQMEERNNNFNQQLTNKDNINLYEHLKILFKENEKGIQAFLANFIKILPYLILLISIVQIAFKYCSFYIPNSQDKNGPSIFTKFISLFFTKQEEKPKPFLNPKKIKNNFEDNPIIAFFGISTQKSFYESREVHEPNLVEINAMLVFLIFNDLLYLIPLIFFVFNSYEAGIITIILKAFKFHFNMKKMKMMYSNMPIIFIFFGHILECFQYNNSFFSPKGFEIFECLCNYAIMLDFLWLFILIERKFNKTISIELDDGNKKLKKSNSIRKYKNFNFEIKSKKFD